MLLVPKQLLRSGMTGNVPYYGGRFTPAQAWAASHPTAPPAAWPPGPAVRPQPAPVVQAGAPSGPTKKAALDHLRDTGVLTAAEYDELMRRIGQ
jgi:hypothetical protein